MSKTQPTKNAVKTLRHPFLSSSAWQWFQKAILLTIFFLVVNHLATCDSFPDGESYIFPIEGFLWSIVFCILIGTKANLNFKFYKKKHFSKKIENSTMLGGISFNIRCSISYYRTGLLL